ncbi:efflux RND transporter permease subunit [Persephonella sp.]|uniref:efflux RND transporter permease subunit n=1 Tax=Persephonella sp. TaxID=2060922 RepID=UPI0025F84824|nr:efflux RND transporter permease subunit [Persephonella sp.]
MKFLEYILKRPHFILSVILSLSFLGIVGFFEIKQKLFPDTNRPTISVVFVYPGASAKDVAENIAIPVEERFYTIDKVRTVSSVSKDEVCVVTVEFEYEKDIEKASVDVQNEINKIRSDLPKGIKEPQIYKITEATQPVIVISVYPEDKNLSLTELRQIAENQIKNRLLKLKEVANVDVFGGYKKEIFIQIDRKKLNKYNLPISTVISKIQQINNDIPIGILSDSSNTFLIKSINKAKNIEELKNLYITPSIKLSDIAVIKYDHYTNSSLFYGNGKPAIALAVQRQPTGDALKTIDAVKRLIPELKKEFPSIGFEISDTQEKIIRLSNLNMLEALRDAIIMTAIVIFFFLSNIRQMIIAGLSIPFVYSITIGIMWLLDMEFNIVTLTAIILALGMLVDDAVVILENIERHLYELKEPVKDAVVNGTKEVAFAVLSGTIATSVVLLPILFVGDFPQTIFRPLAGTLLIAVIVSYFVSITFIPLIAPYLLKKTSDKNRIELLTYRISEFFLRPLKNFYVDAVQLVFKKKILILPYFMGVLILFVVSVKIILPLVGKEIMPPMDTGIVKGSITADSNLSIKQVENIVRRISDILTKDKNVEMFSISVGSEPGVLSMGSGKSPQSISLTVHYVDRFHRKKSIWEIERGLREKIWQIPDIKYVSIFDYGATPLSSIKGNLDVRISGEDLKILDSIGNKMFDMSHHVKGITSVSRSWDYDKTVYNIKVDNKKALTYGLTPSSIASQIAVKLRGTYVSFYNVKNENPIKIRLVFKENQRSDLSALKDYYIDSSKGKIPLTELVYIEKMIEPTVITRQDLTYTLDIIGYREKAAITHIVDSFKKVFESSGVTIPEGYTVSNEGDIKQLMDSLKRMLKAIALGIVLLFFALTPPFRSFLSPFAVISAVPLALIGAAWSTLVMGYHQSMPGLMGVILLTGIITKNSILLIDFIQSALERGDDIQKAIIDSIKIRTRPVLMTAFGTSAGMIPVALGWALGLERLAPLGTVAIGGLIVGTFLTLIYVPIFYYILHKIRKKLFP